MRLLLPFLALFLLAPTAMAATPRVFILHDATDDGYTYAGNLNQFGWVLLDEEGKTHVHKNGKIRILQDGNILYETLGGSGYSTAHDYDALNPFLYRFMSPGNYTVQASVNVSSGVALSAEFNGTVVERRDLVEAALEPVGAIPSTVALARPVPFKFEVRGPGGKPLEHVDALFEVREAATNWLVFRTKLHAHSGPMEAEFSFLEGGSYQVKVIAFQAYPEPLAPAFQPVARTWTVEAKDAPSPVGSIGGFRSDAGDGRYMLLHTYDPAPPGPDYTGTPVVGPQGNVRLNALVYDGKEKRLVPHVDFRATLLNAAEHVLYRSTSLHEYDGVHEVITSPGLPGDYRLQLTAKTENWTASKELSFRITPPTNLLPGVSGSPPSVLPPCVGPVRITVDGVTPLFEEGTVGFAARLLSGDPCPHSEIEIQWQDEKGVPFVINKLHTHADGKFGIYARAPATGAHRLVLDAESIHSDPATSFEPSFLSILAHAPVPSPPEGPVPLQPTAVPGFELVFVGLAAALLVSFRRRMGS